MINTCDAARGKWKGILAALGVDVNLLNGRNQPCPWCGGKDRFRWTDYDGTGGFICNGCGNGSGIDLLQKLRGWDFAEAARAVDAVLGTVPEPMQRASRAKGIPRWWAAAGTPVMAGGLVDQYLANRGLSGIDAPDALREIVQARYRHDNGIVSVFPGGMLTQVLTAGGTLTGVQVTYLVAGGKKASVPTPKKSFGLFPPGSAAQLALDYEDELGVAEGVETALSCRLLFRVPTWAVLGTSGLKNWTPPVGVKHVTVFADNDENGAGLAAAWPLIHRLRVSGIKADIRVPEEVGDFNDVLMGVADED